ncbi:hypothetical protein KP509_15G065000 [Ceratopteris richardii]|uniref:Nuclear receptor corepressor 1 n=1 Tax=Ceratopteris richardii TaxID=49495 RepID=A0A8T2T489_CERRI|nr:hypothetical protein KP509_15G065000 [Ceratopteris richardii]
MYSSTGGEALAAAAAATAALESNQESAISTTHEHSVIAWDRQASGRDRYSAAKDWSSESRSYYRSSVALAGGISIAAPVSKRKPIGRDEQVENGRYRNGVGRSESSSSLLSPPQIHAAERDVCSPSYFSSPGMERTPKSLDGHHHREALSSPSNARHLPSPRVDSRVYNFQNGSEALGTWDRERSRFTSPPYANGLSSRGWDHRERNWSRPDCRRPCPLPKLDVSKEWSQSDRELLEGRIDRYSSLSSREMGFSDVVCTSSRDCLKNERKGRERSSQMGGMALSPSDPTYSRDTKYSSHVVDTLGAISPQQHSPFGNPLAHDSDLDSSGLPSSKKRPRLTWGQGLAKYEKEKTAEEFVGVKKSDGGTFCGTQSETLPVSDFVGGNSSNICRANDVPTQTRCSDSVMDENIQTQQIQIDISQPIPAITQASKNNSPEVHFTEFPTDRPSSSSSPVATSDMRHSGRSLLQCMHAFIGCCLNQEPSNLSKDELTQQVEKVEIEICRLEKELAMMLNADGVHDVLPEKASIGDVQMSPDFAEDSNPADFCSEDSDLCVQPDCEANDPSADANQTAAVTIDPVSCAEGSMHEVCTKDECHHQVVEPYSNDNDITAMDIGHSATAESALIPPEESNCTMHFKDLSISLLAQNQEIAKMSSSALDHLCNHALANSVLSSYNVQDTARWKLNIVSHEKNRMLLKSKIAENQRYTMGIQKVLAVRYRAKREAWKQDQVKLGSCNDNKTNSSLLDDARGKEFLMVQRLLNCGVDMVREYLKMPSMIIGEAERELQRFESKNSMVEDPVAAEQERGLVNPWSAEERRTFLDKYSMFGKNLRKIASYLEHKTVADCVQFFYRNQKSEEFEKIHRRHQLKKRREARSSALYLTSAMTVNNNRQEVNTSYVEGLSLVAAAAAAVSVPRSVKNTALHSNSAVGASYKTYRDWNLAKQVSSASSLTTKGSEFEQSGIKVDQGAHQRPLKKVPDEVLHWRSQWSDNEKKLFINGVAMYGKNFDSISAYIGTKSVGQCKTYFSKTRRRLGLDKLIERQKEFSQGTGHKVTPMTIDTNMESHSEAVSDGQIIEAVEHNNLEKSPLHADSFPVSRGCFDHFHKDPELKPSHKSSPQLMSSASDQPATEPPAHDTQFDTPIDEGVHSTLSDTNGNTVVSCKMPNLPITFAEVPSQGLAGDNLVPVMLSHNMVEPRNTRTESMATANSSTVVSSSMPQIISMSNPVSLVVPPTVHATQIKDKPMKSSECRTRREPTSWTQEEKEKFVEILKVHGKNWDLLCKNLPAKSLVQIKTYFQNSKAKLGLGSEPAVVNSGRVSIASKRKLEDLDSHSNAGSGQQDVPHKESNSKHNPSVVTCSVVSGSNTHPAELVAYANNPNRKWLEENLNAQKILHAMGLSQNNASATLLPIISSSVFPSQNFVSAQQSYAQTVPPHMKMPDAPSPEQPEQSHSSLYVRETKVVQPSPLQQSVVMTCQDSSLPAGQSGCNKQAEQVNLLRQASIPTQQFQQMAEAVLQQFLPQAQRHHKQLQLSGHHFPHPFQHLLNHHQMQSTWSAQAQVPSGTAPPSIATSDLIQHQIGAMQPSHHHAHVKVNTLLQQHQQSTQFNQLQVLQFQRQQQQQQHTKLMQLSKFVSGFWDFPCAFLSDKARIADEALMIICKEGFRFVDCRMK